MTQALEGHHKAPIADISSSHEADYASHLLAETVSVAVADEAGCECVCLRVCLQIKWRRLRRMKNVDSVRATEYSA